MTHSEWSAHLAVEQVVGFIEGRLEPAERTRVEAHLADCAECTSEIVSVRRLARPAAASKRRLVSIVSAAAAAGLLLAVWTGYGGLRHGGTELRELPAPALEAPTPLAPLSTGTLPVTFRWSPVAGADRYRISLFNAEGSVLWESEVAGSTAALPDSVRLAPATQYLWQVAARTGVGRWSAAPLTEFRLGERAR
ncbi:MAG TPA: zf-HC2 domain-containing protein [Gemmatimonadales bacterium]